MIIVIIQWVISIAHFSTGIPTSNGDSQSVNPLLVYGKILNAENIAKIVMEENVEIH